MLLFSQNAPLLSNTVEIHAWFVRLLDLMKRPTPRIDLRLYQLVAELFCHLGNSTKGNFSSEAWISFPPALLKVIQAVRMHPEQKWSVTKMARLACVSAAQLRKLSSHFLHMSPQQWLIRERIAVAQNLLTENSLSVGEIAERCGYSDIYHLSHEFRRHIGISPLAFRKNEQPVET
jgi:transcriptional regulator GlxA family with amidase domain